MNYILRQFSVKWMFQAPSRETMLKDDFSVFFTSELNAGYDTLAYLKHVSGTISTQSSLFTL